MKKRPLFEYNAANGGVMIAFFLPLNLARKLALKNPNAEPAEDLHITVAYLGKRQDLSADDMSVASQVASNISMKYSPLNGNLGGVGRFTTNRSVEGSDVLYLSVDVPYLEEIYIDVVNQLRERGVPYKREHGYTPHVTLAYMEPDIKTALNRLSEPIPITLDTISLTVGSGNNRREDYPLKES